MNVMEEIFEIRSCIAVFAKSHATVRTPRIKCEV